MQLSNSYDKCLNRSDWLDSNKVGNTQMMFHGTKRACSIADNPRNVVCCTGSECNLCCILRGSYNMERAKGGEFPILFPYRSYTYSSDFRLH